MTKADKTQAITDHINASRPCSLSSIIAWVKYQGLGVGNVPQALQAAQAVYVTEDGGRTTVE